MNKRKTTTKTVKDPMALRRQLQDQIANLEFEYDSIQDQIDDFYRAKENLADDIASELTRMRCNKTDLNKIKTKMLKGIEALSVLSSNTAKLNPKCDAMEKKLSELRFKLHAIPKPICKGCGRS